MTGVQTCALPISPHVTIAAFLALDPSRPIGALSYVRGLSLRSTFAATAPRSAVAELGVVRRLCALTKMNKLKKLEKAIPIGASELLGLAGGVGLVYTLMQKLSAPEWACVATTLLIRQIDSA